MIDVIDAIDIHCFSEADQQAFCDKYGDQTVKFDDLVKDLQKELFIT